MIFKAIAGLLCVLIFYSCKQAAPASGLKIEYKPTRGQSYTHPQGERFNLRHIPTIITNDSSVSIHIQIAFSKGYDYPATYDDVQFKIFPMPKIWALDGVDITDSILQELPPYIKEPTLTKTLHPGESWYLGLGILYPRNINYGVFPVAVFSHENRMLSHECKELINPDELPISPSSLELLIGFTDGSQASPNSCMSLTFAHISYPE